MADPSSSPECLPWRRLDSRRPSPIGIMLNSDDGEGDDVSVATTPIRRQGSIPDLYSRRRVRSLDDLSVLESLSDLIFSEKDCSTTISPIELPNIDRVDPIAAKQVVYGNSQASPHVILSDSPSDKIVSPYHTAGESESFAWERDTRTSVSPETLTQWKNSTQLLNGKPTRSGPLQEHKPSFWDRSPIAKGMKDAIWSKRVGTPIWSDVVAKQGPPRTPSRNDILVRREPVDVPPSTPPRTDHPTRRASLNGSLLSTPLARSDYIRRSSGQLPPSTPSTKPDISRRPSTPTMLGGFGTRQGLTTRREQIVWQHPQSSRKSMQAISDESNGGEPQRGSRGNLRSRSASFGTGPESNGGGSCFVFRAPRIGKLGVVINSSPKSGPVVEQVKDYSTLFGCILVGDKIVEVDGIETSHMTSKEVTKRLTGKYGILATSNEVKIKVVRTRERDWNEDEEASVGYRYPENGSLVSFASQHRRNYSDPVPPLLGRLTMNHE